MGVVILYGSETGTCEVVADHIADVFAAHGDASVYDMTEFDIADLDPADFYVLVVATYGEGELPTGALPFFDDIDAEQPDLTGLRFAVFGLGDKVYDDTYNRGGEIAGEKLTALGAVQIGEHGRHDSSGDRKPKDQAIEWAETIVPLAAD
ncbi:flavodoxin domain-containing protein [Antrihabitans sp. YC2-6]|uniref:flavodoxin domain-containing protein n=1 Tax=Antrihabitans sp. YC2-6 TaxID=2799498 RepID=UPI0018F48070|nr:flavodoxin domain-containing protein [Antrihabitans sp. YC2-6]MBJ8344993.1 flavodoxin domain-containing protein [Antrihabitans sp. YC2-6]